jgi:hypothetical protein
LVHQLSYFSAGIICFVYRVWMDNIAELGPTDLRASIMAALRVAQALDNTLVQAMLSEALDAAAMGLRFEDSGTLEEGSYSTG